MKRPRHILLASSLLTLLAAACSKDDLVPEATQPTDGADGLVEMTFTVTAAPATRTTLGEKGANGKYPVLWTSGDEIVVMPAYGRFDKSELEEMKFTTSIEGGTAATATFTGRTQPSENGYIAFYPADKLVEYSGQYLNYFVDSTIPTEQRAIAGNFESGIAPAYAKADQEGGDLEFNPMCGLVKFSLAGDVGNIKSVRFEAGGQVLSGTYSCNLWLSTSYITGSESSKSHVILTGPFVAREDYYMVVAPCSLSGGFSFTFTRDDGSIHVKSGKIDDGYISGRYMGNFGTIDLSDATFGKPLETDITDMAFIQIVEETAGITLERNAAGYVPLTEANLETMASVPALNISEKGLTDLSALKYFTGLQTLDCSRNSLTELDVSALTKLDSLSCSFNSLTELDVRELTNLTTLDCSLKNLTKLNVSGQTNLTSLDCSDNQLTALDVSKLTGLTDLDCADNQLTALDLNGLTELENLDCSENRMSSLNISEFLNLYRVKCGKQTADGVKSRTLTLTLTAAQKAGGVFNASSEYNVDVNLNVVGQ